MQRLFWTLSNPQVPMASQMLQLDVSNSDLIVALASRQGTIERGTVTESGSLGEAPEKSVAMY